MSSSSSYEPPSSTSSEDEIEDIESQMIENHIDQMIQQLGETIPQIVQSQNNRRTRRYINRNHENGQVQLYQDYFAERPVYSDEMFRRRFRMRRPLFLRVVQAVEAYDVYFQQLPDCTGRAGLTSLQKCTAAIRVLAYGESYDRVDEYLRIGETTTRVVLDKFTNAVIAQFGEMYLRRPTVSDLQRLLDIGARRGFPGMLGSVDCMHWQWKNCPVAWRGQYQGRSGRATVVLEAVASYDLWIWHSFFGIPGSCNDITVLHRSPLFDDVLNGKALNVNFSVNGHQYDTGYYLADGIYPQWATFVPSIFHPVTPKDKYFAEKQESARKDIERAFGVLQARFAVIKRPACTWDPRLMGKIMKTCIILHNMIVEDERDNYANYADERAFHDANVASVENSAYTTGHQSINVYVANRTRLRDSETHVALKKDLIENVWAMKNCLN